MGPSVLEESGLADVLSDPLAPTYIHNTSYRRIKLGLGGYTLHSPPTSRCDEGLLDAPRAPKSHQCEGDDVYQMRIAQLSVAPSRTKDQFVHRQSGGADDTDKNDLFGSSFDASLRKVFYLLAVNHASVGAPMDSYIREHTHRCVSHETDKEDWEISLSLFQRINQEWGPFTINCFMTTENWVLPRFNSQWWCPMTLGIDAFVQTNWEMECN